jgi:hypothetical protein
MRRVGGSNLSRWPTTWAISTEKPDFTCQIWADEINSQDRDPTISLWGRIMRDYITGSSSI